MNIIQTKLINLPFKYVILVISFFTFNLYSSDNKVPLHKETIKNYSKIIKQSNKNFPWDKHDKKNQKDVLYLEQKIQKFYKLVNSSLTQQEVSSDNKSFHTTFNTMWNKNWEDTNINQLKQAHIGIILNYLSNMKFLLESVSDSSLNSIKKEIGLPFFLHFYLSQPFDGYSTDVRSNIYAHYQDKLCMVSDKNLHRLDWFTFNEITQNFAPSGSDWGDNITIKALKIEDDITYTQAKTDTHENILAIQNTSKALNLAVGETCAATTFCTPFLSSLCTTRSHTAAIAPDNIIWVHNKENNEMKTYKMDKSITHLLSYNNSFVAADTEKIYFFTENPDAAHIVNKEIIHLNTHRDQLVTVQKNSPNIIDFWQTYDFLHTKSFTFEEWITNLTNIILDTNQQVMKVHLGNKYCFVTPKDHLSPTERLFLYNNRTEIMFTNWGQVLVEQHGECLFMRYPIPLTDAWKQITVGQLILIGLLRKISYCSKQNSSKNDEDTSI